MGDSLISSLRALADLTLLLINTLVHATPPLLFALIKLLIPIPAFRRAI